MVALDRAIGFGPNFWGSFEYYENSVEYFSYIEDDNALEVIETTLHGDIELEDIHIMVRTKEGHEISLQFEEAHKRTINDSKRAKDISACR